MTHPSPDKQKAREIDDLMGANVSLVDGVITIAFGDEDIAARVFDALTHNGGPDNG